MTTDPAAEGAPGEGTQGELPPETTAVLSMAERIAIALGTEPPTDGPGIPPDGAPATDAAPE